MRLWGIILWSLLGTGANLDLPPVPSVASPTVTLAWDPVPGVAGYKIYEGPASHIYTNSIDVGNVTNATITRTYGTNYFAATSYYSNGAESLFSTEAVLAPPAPVPVYGLLFNQGSTDGVTWVDLTPQPFLRITNPGGGPLPWQWFRSRTENTTNWR